MERSAVLHIPMSEYAYGLDENHVVIRLRTKREDLDECKLFYGDRCCKVNPLIFYEADLKLEHRTELYDYYEAVLENTFTRICYYFQLKDKDEEILYFGDCFCSELPEERAELFQLPFNHRADIVNPPAWAKDAIIYNIFPDSFATSKDFISKKSITLNHNGVSVSGRNGGTIKGITENVEYLQNLGVNAIYINPIFAAGEYHKYDLVDYFSIDPCFGTNEDFKELVNVYHDHGIKVIIDGVFNHCGWNFFAFNDVVENGENSKYKDWFYDLTFPVVKPDNSKDIPGYACFAYERKMPKLNLANPEARDYFVRVGKYWIEEFGIDGWRLDVANEINDGFWRAYHNGVKSVNKDAILIGEVWETANHWLDGTIFDSAMNYDFRNHCTRFIALETIDAMEFANRVTHMYVRYRKQTTFAQLNLLDSHDVSRFLSVCNNDLQKYKMALLFQMTFPGMPSIFYGDEKGITGITEEEYRHPMVWDGKEDDLLLYYKELIALRKDNIVLRYGKFNVLDAKKGSKQFSFVRKYGNDQVIVVLNMSDDKMDITDYLKDGKILIESRLDNNILGAKGFIAIGK